MSTTFTQEMPPKGGFGEVHYKAVPTKRWVSNKKLALGILVGMVYAGYRNDQARRKLFYNDVCNNDALLAMEPFLAAERDRNYLTVLYNNREMEKKIMGDVHGWKSGTFYGVPFFKTLDKDSLLPELMGTFNLHVKEEAPRNQDPQRQGLSRWRFH